MLEPGLKLSEFPERGLIGRIFRQPDFQFLHPALKTRQFAADCGDEFDQRFFIPEKVQLLMKQADPRFLRNRDLAFIGGKLSGNHGKERTLPRSVRPDHTDPFTFFHAE